MSDLISLTELARRVSDASGEPFTRQAAHKAAGEGLFPVVTQGKKKLVNPEDPAVKEYIAGDNRQREQAKKKDIIEAANKAIEKDKSEIGNKKPVKNKPASGRRPTYSPDLPTDPFEIKQRTLLAEMRKKEAQAKILEKQNLPRDFIEGGMFRYITRLNSTIERTASVYIDEVGQKILEAGEVTPEHIQSFIALCLQAVDDCKKNILKEIKYYDPKSN